MTGAPRRKPLAPKSPRSAADAEPGQEGSRPTRTSGTDAKRRRLSAGERRAQIIETARGVFLAKGMAGARTRDIAQVAGVNEALLYQHFASKEELFEEAVVKPLDEIMKRVTEAGAAIPAYDPAARTQQDLTQGYLCELLRTFIDAGPLLGVVLFSDRAAGERFYDRSIRPLARTISGAVQDSFPTWSHRDFDPELVTFSMIGTCISLSLESHFGGKKVDAQDTARQLTDLLFFGLLDPKNAS